jgi:hypothetical protein
MGRQRIGEDRDGGVSTSTTRLCLLFSAPPAQVPPAQVHRLGLLGPNSPSSPARRPSLGETDHPHGWQDQSSKVFMLSMGGMDAAQALCSSFIGASIVEP